MAPKSNKSRAAGSSSGSRKNVEGEGEIYQFKVRLLDVKPPVWRRVLVNKNTSFSTFHKIINKAMGWKNKHLFQFTHKDINISEWTKDDFSDDDDEERLESKAMSLKDFYETEGPVTLIYEYDFGDSWEHTVTLEKKSHPEEGQTYPVCIAGKRACPPEDCGSSCGYEEFLEQLNNPEHEEHIEVKEWAESCGYVNFDPAKFDPKDVTYGPGFGVLKKKK